MQKTYILPHLNDDNADSFSETCYTHFLSHLARIISGDDNFKIYMAITQTANTLTSSQEHIARKLVEMGLVAKKSAFPKSFLHHIEENSKNKKHSIASLTTSQEKLVSFWKTYKKRVHSLNLSIPA